MGKSYDCKIVGTFNGGTAESDLFNISFSPCESPEESCFVNTWDDLPTDDLTWDPPEPIEFSVF